MKSDSAAGFDGLSINVLKQVEKPVSLTLAQIFNKILNEGVIPISFKKATVTPLYKSGPKSDLTNYRPISLLNVFSKIFEKAIKTRHELFRRK